MLGYDASDDLIIGTLIILVQYVGMNKLDDKAVKVALLFTWLSVWVFSRALGYFEGKISSILSQVISRWNLTPVY